MAISFARSISLALSCALIPALAACGPAASEPVDSTEAAALEAASALQGSGHHPPPVIFDTDMDFDDASALALLCQEHKQGHIRLAAVTVANDGAGLPGSAVRHARCVLERCGLLDEVPVADGSLVGVNTAPPELRGAIEAILSGAFAECTQSPEPSAESASELIADVLGSAHQPVTLVTTGPLSNVSLALASGGQSLVGKIGKMFVMGGALEVAGNLFTSATTAGFDNSQEFNIWIDPPAAQRVLTAVPPWTVRLVPLDATNHVPITPAFVDRLSADQETAEAQMVHSIVTQPIASFGIGLGLFYWWDPLTAVAATRNDDVVSFDKTRSNVVQTGPQAGRTVESNKGARIRAAFDADQALFEQTFLDALNGRSPCDDDGDD
jgi:purine nucleosidase